jgi:hypothetical protein
LSTPQNLRKFSGDNRYDLNRDRHPSGFLDVRRFHEAESPALLSKRTLLPASSTPVHNAHEFDPHISRVPFWNLLTERLQIVFPSSLLRLLMMEESRFEIVSPSSRVVGVSTIPDLSEEKQVSFLIHAII